MFTTPDRTADGASIIRGAPGYDTLEAQPEYQDPLDDVFGSVPASPTHNNDELRAGAELSDIPRLRSLHVTNGYREGISIGKEASIQSGFDEGYALGAEYGHLAAWVKGVLLALRSMGGQQDELAALTVAAEKDLSLETLISPAYFDEHGIWSYKVPGASEDTTFRLVAAAHPLLVKWKKIAIGQAAKAGVTIG